MEDDFLPSDSSARVTAGVRSCASFFSASPRYQSKPSARVSPLLISANLVLSPRTRIGQAPGWRLRWFQFLRRCFTISLPSRSFQKTPLPCAGSKLTRACCRNSSWRFRLGPAELVRVMKLNPPTPMPPLPQSRQRWQHRQTTRCFQMTVLSGFVAPA